MNVLERGQVISEIRLPRRRQATQSIFLKAMDRAAWDFALTSVAMRLDVEGDRILDARVVLGGVAPVPWREPRVEQMLRAAEVGQELAAKVSASVLGDAVPLAHNKYKIRLARALVKRALAELSRYSAGGS